MSSFVARLTSRSILRIGGRDAWQYLQGLVANDMRQLAAESLDEVRQVDAALFTGLLTHNGRLICDALVYRDADPNAFAMHAMDVGKGSQEKLLRLAIPTHMYLECPSTIAEALAKHLRRYRLRMKVTIDDITDRCTVVASAGDAALSLPTASSLASTQDPRLAQMGHRAVWETAKLPSDVTIAESETDYHIHRISLGVPEGTTDIPSEKSFPSECNFDYLNGQSLTKGCYLGQELTARTHYQGTIRKRLVVATLSNGATMDSTDTALVCAQTGETLGRVRSTAGSHAIAMVRLKHFHGARQRDARLESHPDVPVRLSLPDYLPDATVVV